MGSSVNWSDTTIRMTYNFVWGLPVEYDYEFDLRIYVMKPKFLPKIQKTINNICHTLKPWIFSLITDDQSLLSLMKWSCRGKMCHRRWNRTEQSKEYDFQGSNWSTEVLWGDRLWKDLWKPHLTYTSTLSSSCLYWCKKSKLVPRKWVRTYIRP